MQNMALFISIMLNTSNRYRISASLVSEISFVQANVDSLAIE